MWARVKSFFFNLWLDQGLTGCHVKWTLATLHRTKKQRFQFIVTLRTLSLLLGNLKARSVSNGKVRESNHITTWNNQKNLEQLNTLNHRQQSTWAVVHAYCALNVHFPARINVNKKKPDFTHLCVLFIISSSSKFIWAVVHIFPRHSIIVWTKRRPGSRTRASCYYYYRWYFIRW